MAPADKPADSRTAKVISLYTADPRAHKRSGLPSRPQAAGHPNTDGFGTDGADIVPINNEILLPDEPVAPRDPVRHSPLFSLGGLRSAVADSLIATSGFIRERMTGEYSVDDFGFDPHFAETVFFPAIRQVYQKWFRVEVSGIENLPAVGGALLVGNHAGSLPVDGLISSVAVRDNHPNQRYLRLLAADMVFDTPVLGDLARRTGATLACNEDAESLLRKGELAAVWPEGYKGLGKPYKDRYKLQRFGRGGFVTTAIRTQAPIIPMSIVGSEEIYPMIADLKPLAKALGLPYFPVTPLFPWLGPLGLVPLPSKWHIHFGRPIDTSSYEVSSADDPMVVFDLTDHVREEIQQTLFRMLSRRGSVYLG
ncbi:glycerol acyltransferase [Gordonia iterans]|uniref:Glycerol acyltransferase n=1 Tax=Gordonia iterans TaxID=1004901 RepID=A0A2S0KJ53_9ACTN|nr:lysophospholipid acyltransferase family protein [Gordonia iterans]AVM01710.1 glycerol acyltransferase [Gordonia iterans]